MIVTFTANPSLDRTAELDALVRGEVLRTSPARVDAGGKGVNVTRALHANAIDSVAVLPTGGYEGQQLTGLLAAEGLHTSCVPIAGRVRANITIAEADGTTTKLNEPGPLLSEGEVAALGDALVHAARGASWVVLAGSLPPGAPEGLYAELTGRLHDLGVRVAVDAEGPLLRATLAARPDVIKPNDEELAAATGLPVSTPAQAADAARVLLAHGARAVLASLGAQGAVLVDDSGVHHAHAPARPRSTVGAGDATLAGFLSLDASGPDALATAVAWGAAAVSLPGSRMPSPEDIDLTAVQVVSLDSEEVPK